MIIIYVCTVSDVFDPKLKNYFDEDDLNIIREKILFVDSMKYVNSAPNTNANYTSNNSSDSSIDFMFFIKLGIVLFIIIALILGY